MYQQKSKEAAADPIGTRLRTLLLLMRGSGLAICDAVTLEREPLNKNGELLLYRAKDWNASSCKAAAGCGEGIARSAAWSKTETALLLLEWKRGEEKRGCGLATRVPKVVRFGRSQKAGRNQEALLPAYAARYLRD